MGEQDGLVAKKPSSQSALPFRAAETAAAAAALLLQQLCPPSTNKHLF
jgi:hypothetical protein